MLLCVQDLRDRLWDICDARKEEAEQERLDIINESWLQDSTGIAMNHFFSLMQVRVAGQNDTDSALYGYSPPINHPSGNVRGHLELISLRAPDPGLSPNLPRNSAEINHFKQTPELGTSQATPHQLFPGGLELWRGQQRWCLSWVTTSPAPRSRYPKPCHRTWAGSVSAGT